MKTALSILNQSFGYPSFRGKQAEIISHVVSGGSCLVLMPTGGGKSLCYQIPALIRPGLGLVISPLIALMQDQVQALKQNGIEAEFYNSSMQPSDKDRVRQLARAGGLQLLYVAPETLNTEAFNSFIDSLPLSLIAVDEAHCVAQWGHDFRPDYLHIAKLRQRFVGVPLIALTATADEATRQEILSRLQLEGAPVFASSFDRPNIRYQITLKDSGKEQLLDFIKTKHPGDAGIVYCLSRKRVEETATWLSTKGVRALPYHAGLSAEMRRDHQERFLRDEGLVMTATIAFGMGIDKPNVRFVAHLDLPKSVEGYYQETGRAGRDGEPSSAWMAYSLGDVVQLRQMIQQGQGADDFKRLSQAKLNAMLGLCETVQCRRQALLNYFGDAHDGQCRNCDNCMEAPKSYDGTEAAQKALSTVARTGERFGTGQLIDVLMGKATEKVKRMGHDRLTVFGVGMEKNEKQWSSVFRQLVAGDYVSVDLEFGAIKLNERSWDILKRGAKVSLREDPAARIKTRKEAQRGKLPLASGSDADAFESLRALRLKIAKEQNLPPYVIFHDATLREMISLRPMTLIEFSRVPGVGEAKLKRYGPAFLEALGTALDTKVEVLVPPASKQRVNHQESLNTTLAQFQQGLVPAEIAAARGLTVTTIYEHLGRLIEAGKLTREAALPLSRREFDAVSSALAESDGKLKPVFEKFEGKYSYDVLKCVHASTGMG